MWSSGRVNASKWVFTHLPHSFRTGSERSFQTYFRLLDALVRAWDVRAAVAHPHAWTLEVLPVLRHPRVSTAPTYLTQYNRKAHVEARE